MALSRQARLSLRVVALGYLVALLLVAGWNWLSRRARRALLKPTIPSIALTQNVLEKGDN